VALFYLLQVAVLALLGSVPLPKLSGARGA
jgi:hypothetical protein